MYQLALQNLTEQDALKLFRLGTWTTVPEGASLLTQGQPEDSVKLIASESVGVEMDGRLVDELNEGRFLGATAFLRAGKDFTAPVTV